MLLIFIISLSLSLMNLQILREMISSSWNMPRVLKESSYYLFFLATLPAIVNLFISIFSVYKIFDMEGFYGFLYIGLCIFIFHPLILKITKINILTTILFRTAFSPIVITTFLLIVIFLK
jgi:hypothetical protein